MELILLVGAGVLVLEMAFASSTAQEKEKQWNDTSGCARQLTLALLCCAGLALLITLMMAGV